MDDPPRGCRNPRGRSRDKAECRRGTWYNTNSRLPAFAPGTGPCSNPTGLNGMSATCIPGRWRSKGISKCYGEDIRAARKKSDRDLWLSYGNAVNVTLWSGPYAGKDEMIVGIQLGYGEQLGNLFGSKTNNERA